MNKQELLKAIESYPEDTEIIIWGVLCGYCGVTDIVEMDIEDKNGNIKKAIKLC